MTDPPASTPDHPKERKESKSTQQGDRQSPTQPDKTEQQPVTNRELSQKRAEPSHSSRGQSSGAVTDTDAHMKPADATVEEAPALEETSKKKSRLQWDEDNLISNAQEMERAGPRMKIDEPKTPYVQGSETGSSTSGSAHQSPPESPSFIPGERLVGFCSLEASMRRSSSGGGASSDGASSAGSGGRSVQISDAHSSGGSSPRSKEIFAARRKAHYRNEAARLGKIPLSGGRVDDDDDDSDDDLADGINGHQNGERIPNGRQVGVGSSTVRDRLAMLNRERDEESQNDAGDND